MNIGKNTCFWIFSLHSKSSTEYLNYSGNYITFFERKTAKKNDIILLYSKNKQKSGFFGIVKLGLDPKPSPNINIFKNLNLNKFYSPLSTKIMFDQPIKLDKVMNTIKNEESGYKNSLSFKNKFLKYDNAIQQIPIKGKELTEKLLEINELNKEETKEADDNREEEIEEEIEEPDNEKIEDGETEEVKENEKVLPGFIPILIIPCNDFKLPTKKKEKYFVSHYKSCNKCNEVNNNNKGLHPIIDQAIIEFKEITDQKDEYFDPILNDYLNCLNHEPSNCKGDKFIRVAYINNNHEVYKGCLFITRTD